MNGNMKYTHPEVYKEVYQEYQRLHSKHPMLDMEYKWTKAFEFVQASLLADKHLFLHFMGQA